MTAPRRLAAAILTSHVGLLPGGRLVAAEVSSTGFAILIVAPPGRPAAAVIKVAVTDAAGRGLERETAALRALHDDERLGEWRRVVPRPLASGSIDGRSYRVDTVLTGQTTLEGTRGWRTVDLAAELVGRLHRATSTTGRQDLGDAWVDQHLNELARHEAWHRRAHAFEQLRHELRAALAGKSFSVGRIHGDYWLGNIVWKPAGSTSMAPAGIVDWEASAPDELPAQDILHLVLYTRRLRTGCELATSVRAHLLGGEWSRAERALLARFGGWGRDAPLSERHFLLLYWLRHIAMHTRQQDSPGGYRYRLWARRNIDPVLGAL